MRKIVQILWIAKDQKLPLLLLQPIFVNIFCKIKNAIAPMIKISK